MARRETPRPAGRPPDDRREAEADEVARRAVPQTTDEADIRRAVGGLLGRDFAGVRVQTGAADLEAAGAGAETRGDEVRVAPGPEDWSFTPDEYRTLRKGGGELTFASGSEWLPEPIRENLLATLGTVLDRRRAPGSTEGVNVHDFFHGHVVIPGAKRIRPANAQPAGKN